jgi:hypothetical protein
VRRLAITAAGDGPDEGAGQELLLGGADVRLGPAEEQGALPGAEAFVAQRDRG